jgi:hypothetical protein
MLDRQSNTEKRRFFLEILAERAARGIASEPVRAYRFGPTPRHRGGRHLAPVGSTVRQSS